MRYFEIKNEKEYEYVVKRSRFIAHTYKVYSEDEVKENLDEMKKLFYKANHHCYAFHIKGNIDLFRYSDNGEPNNSAGLPIYHSILKHEVTNVLVIVSRIFGGTKLGIPGLIEAYGETALTALKLSGREEIIPLSEIKLKIPYELENQVLHFYKNYSIKDIERDYKEKLIQNIKLPEEEVDDFQEALKSQPYINKIDWRVME